jgi:hypothetical protein
MKRLILYCVLSFALQIALYAQTMTEVRQMRYEAIGVFDKYYSLILNMDNPDVYTYDYFTALFEDDATIYNDILPENKNQYLNPKEYYQKYVKGFKTYPRLSDLELSFPEFKDGKWNVNVKFKKTIQIKYRKKELSYPKWIFNYEMHVVMDINPNYSKGVKNRNAENNSQYSNVKIKSLKVEDPLVNYYVINLNDTLIREEVKGLYYKPTGEQIDFMGDSCRIFNFNKISRSDLVLNKSIDDDFRTTIAQHPLDNKYYKYDILPLKKIIGFGISYSPLLLDLNVPTPYFENIKQNAFTTGISFLYGWLLSKPSQNKFYLNLKPGYSMNYIGFKGSSFYEYQSVDSDNDSYTRQINLTSVKENNFFHSVDFPITFSLVRSIGNYALTFDVGGWVNYSFLNSHKSTANALYSGYYPQYWDLVIDKNGYYDFGEYVIGETKSNKFTNFLDYGAIVSLGGMYKLQAGLYLKMDIAYRYGFVDKANFVQNYQPTKETGQYTPFFNSINQWKTNNVNINISIIKKI